MTSRPIRKKNRIPEYDYSEPNVYFLTVCITDRKNILWDLQKVKEPLTTIPLSIIGSVVDEAIRDIPNHYSNVVVDKYVIMPNHIHMILVLSEPEKREVEGELTGTPTISRIIHQWKSVITKRIGQPIWQKSFYDHIIRNDEEYTAFLDYIEDNPLKWVDDAAFGS